MAKTHRVSGRAVVIKDDKILLTKFKNGQYYNFPGGGVEEGETLLTIMFHKIYRVILTKVQMTTHWQ